MMPVAEHKVVYLNHMHDLLKAMKEDIAILITAPPGWGKTYRLLSAIKETNIKVCFVFPLRALCEEVYLSALKMNISVLNIRSLSDYQTLQWSHSHLIVTTPETLVTEFFVEKEYVFILDELHLFFYWGDSFRYKMQESYFDILSTSCALILLTATLEQSLKERLVRELEVNYRFFYHMNIGNHQLKNLPSKIYFYPKKLKRWLKDDFFIKSHQGTTLIFCRYRNEVREIVSQLRKRDYSVLGCVGGEALDFTQELQRQQFVDYIVATSVISHGVNLPEIRVIYMTFKVENYDFYLQMVGRGGRSGGKFDLHTFNHEYFKWEDLLFGFLRTLLKRFSNRVYSLLYCFYEN